MTSFGEKLLATLDAERERLGGKLPRARWIELANATAQAEGVLRKRKPKGAARARNPLFDALALATGALSLEQITRNQAQAIGVALADIMTVCPDLTVEEINRRAIGYKKRWPDPRNWSAPALAKHWAEFGDPNKPTRTGYETAPEPAWDWRAAARRVCGAMPESRLKDDRLAAIAEGYKWGQIGPEFRKLIFEEGPK